MSWLFASGGQSVGTWASASVLPMNIHGWYPLGLTSFISLLSKGLSGVFSSTIIWKHQFFGAQPSLWSNSHTHNLATGKTIAVTKWTFVGKVMSLLFNTLCRFVIFFLPRSKHLLISWLQSLSTGTLEPEKLKSAAMFTFSQSTCYETMGLDVMVLAFWMLSFKPAFSLSSFTLNHPVTITDSKFSYISEVILSSSLQSHTHSPEPKCSPPHGVAVESGGRSLLEFPSWCGRAPLLCMHVGFPASCSTRQVSVAWQPLSANSPPPACSWMTPGVLHMDQTREMAGWGLRSVLAITGDWRLLAPRPTRPRPGCPSRLHRSISPWEEGAPQRSSGREAMAWGQPRVPGVEAGPGGARGHSQTLRARTAAGGIKSKACGPPRASRLPRNPPAAPLEKVTAGRGQQVMDTEVRGGGRHTPAWRRGLRGRHGLCP